MKISRIMRLGIAALIGVFAQVSSTQAQVSEGRFTGTVIDQSGSAVPGATVVVKNERTAEDGP
jgi:hypothetical protein